jgi:hypothetical protein
LTSRWHIAAQIRSLHVKAHELPNSRVDSDAAESKMSEASSFLKMVWGAVELM